MKNHMRLTAVLFLVALFIGIALPAMAGTVVTGEVSVGFEIVADDGTVYTIMPSEKGDELASMIGEVVRVTGTVQEEEGEKTITVESFTVVNQ